MRYEVQYNPARKIWVVWKIYTYGAEIVKTFKTETAAKKYVSKQ